MSIGESARILKVSIERIILMRKGLKIDIRTVFKYESTKRPNLFINRGFDCKKREQK
jgi:hypothetical protein